MLTGFLVIATIVCAFQGADGKPPSRAVGGVESPYGEFPYMAAVMVKYRQMCGGVIISKRHILSAAHCFHGLKPHQEQNLRIVTGTGTIAVGAGTSHEIKNVTLHPDYSPRSEDSWIHDITVVALSDDIVFGPSTTSLRLPEVDTPANLRSIAAGWGDLSYKGVQPININKISMTTITNDECDKLIKSKIYKTHLCAFEAPGVGLCTGDSGGPLVYNGTVVGIASFVLPCARGSPDVFTRVYSYLDFINKAMANT